MNSLHLSIHTWFKAQLFILWKRSAKRVKLCLSRGFSQFFKILSHDHAVSSHWKTRSRQSGNQNLSMAGPSMTETLEIIGIYIMYVYNACVSVRYYLYLCYDSRFLSENVCGCPHDRNQVFAFWKGSEHHLPKPSHLSFQAAPLDGKPRNLPGNSFCFVKNLPVPFCIMWRGYARENHLEPEKRKSAKDPDLHP